MSRRSRQLQFSAKARKEIYDRDGRSCIFCRMGYRNQGHFAGGTGVYETMHIVSRAHGGLGVARNGIVGCKYHHTLLDSGPKETRDEMQTIIENYMKSKYPGWNRDQLIYRKD